MDGHTDVCNACRAPARISLISLSRRRSSAARCNDDGAIMAALTEIRHCFPCRGGVTMGRRRRRRRSEPKCQGRDREQREGKIKRYTYTGRGGKRKDRGGKNARETSTSKNSLSPISLSLSLRLYLSRSPSLCLRQYAGERLPILRQGQDRDFNQLAGFLGPGK